LLPNGCKQCYQDRESTRQLGFTFPCGIVFQYALDTGLYVVRYDTLIEEDESQPLTITVFPKELRPKPPHITVFL